MSFRTIVWIVFLLFIIVLPVPAETIVSGKVVRVSDGDTFTILTEEKKQVRIRIYGIDAPEIKQPFSEKSREFLADMIAGKEVAVIYQGTDNYERVIGKVKVGNIPDVGLEMLKAGFAWHYSYFDNTQSYIMAESRAKANKRGLWVDKNPINPYLYRKSKK
ncbi:thermonuclease family protein [Parabacteroides sp. PF5-9]|uniref:thermonuclease family protein n=1 Tax=Parabacteroides sp. PF5-9 TaxID=1742404 RepID=UPI00247393F7|nr:thermonuclease family protein [Parabacteroides sp. PF5-9]MDH6358948.1 micrococcal nuclease [Parabacteroides sp. PF5-9]